MRFCYKFFVMSAITTFLLGIGLLQQSAFAKAEADDDDDEGWESIDTRAMIRRSRFICTGKLIYGKRKTKTVKAKIVVSRTIYSGVGSVKEMKVTIAKETIPGKKKNWRNWKKGVWIVLKKGDQYAAINHPSCWLKHSKARWVADEVYKWQQEEYGEAEEDSEDDDNDDDDDDSSDSDSDNAYKRLADAALAASRVPYQDPAKQNQLFYNQAMTILKSAGITPPFPTNLSKSSAQKQLISQFKQILGPFASKLPKDPKQQLLMAQNLIAQTITKLVSSTIGSANPAEALKNMGPIKLPMNLGGGKKGGKSFKLPMDMLSKLPINNNNSKQMLKMGLNMLGGKKPQMPKMPKMGGSGVKGPGGPPRGPGF